jgi:AmmeMemoRadiSam system protein B
MEAMTDRDRNTRPPAVAGLFYPDDQRELRQLVEGFLAEVDQEPTRVRGAVVPHAGLVYSGRCAAEIFGRVTIPRSVIILAPNHFGVMSKPARASVWKHGSFGTPLGQVSIDEDLATQLLDSCPLVAHDPLAHKREHAIEVELPFLTVLASDTVIVPILLAWDDWGYCAELATALADLLAKRDDDALILASSDMTHYESADSAEQKDQIALAAIEQLDGQGLLSACRRERISMCGRAAVATATEASRRLGAKRATVVDYRHSGMVTGDHASVVAYAGILIP